MNNPPSNRWTRASNRSLFLLGAVFLHLIAFLIAATIVFPGKQSKPVEEGFQQAHSLPPVQLAKMPPVNTSIGTMDIGVSSSEPAVPILTPSHNGTLSLPAGPATGDEGLPPSTIGGFKQPSPTPRDPNLPTKQLTQESWKVPGQTDHYQFPIYLAKYADGDWNCNNYNIASDAATAGCLPNLAAKLTEWSHGKITVLPPKAIAIDSPELIAAPPPFLFFTGHKDFVLTSSEIENLQKYLVIGGAIWGDSAFAGDGSRFDVAFHREMKRVIPDEDKNFEPLDLTHEIFTNGLFKIDRLPGGLNYRSDPIEVINIDGKLAIIYTPNDYSDMMTMVLQPGSNEHDAKIDPFNRARPNHPLFTPASFNSHHAVYYRNYDAASGMSVYKLSTNILVHLLNRF